MLGFTKAMNKVSPLLTKEQQLILHDHVNYDLMVERLVDLIAEGT